MAQPLPQDADLLGPQHLLDLEGRPSFVSIENGMISCWSVEETGHPETDLALGRRLAEEVLKHRDLFNGENAWLAFALANMIERGRCGHVETGFILRIASAASAGIKN